MKKDAYYFPHFSNARTDSKILKLRRVLGIEGYGIYFMLLEVLREQTDYMLPLSSVEDLEFEFRVSKEKINTVITNYDLFEVIDDKFFSPKLIFFLQPYLEKTIRARTAAQIRWNNANADANADANAMQGEERRVKESKGKESKVKEIKDIIPPVEEFLKYCGSFVNLTDYRFTLSAKYQAWVDAGWKDGNGEKIKNWKTKIKNTVPYLKPFQEVKKPENKSNAPVSLLERYRSPLMRDGITLAEYVAEFDKMPKNALRIDLEFINQTYAENSDKWKKAVVMKYYDTKI